MHHKAITLGCTYKLLRSCWEALKTGMKSQGMFMIKETAIFEERFAKDYEHVFRKDHEHQARLSEPNCAVSNDASKML